MHQLLPNLRIEMGHWQQGRGRVAGVDEVGRGCLAGGVMAAAVILPAGDPEGLAQALAGVRDSKQLSRSQRQKLLPVIVGLAQAVGLGGATVAEIERLNIRRATILAMRRALAQVQPLDWVLLDGPELPDLGIPHTGIIRGDQQCLSIAAAAIVAKVRRDGAMARLARRYPGYGWERNAGYGTAQHYQGLAQLGPTRHHRRSFL
ncbi:MAG: ribonuclease HII [Thermostichales cyanobacterium BF4_bins_65]